MQKFFLTLFVGSLTLLSGCSTSSHVVVGPTRPAVDSSLVKVYLRPPARYDEIAVLDASSRGSLAVSSQSKTNRVINRLKEEAGDLGANGILLTGVQDQYGGSFSTGNAVASTYGNTTTAFGVGTAIPIINKTGSALAIYVYEEKLSTGNSANFSPGQTSSRETIFIPPSGGPGEWVKLTQGMSRKSVRVLLGEPKEIKGEEGNITWRYADDGMVTFKEYFVFTWELPKEKSLAEISVHKQPADPVPALQPTRTTSEQTASTPPIALPEWLEGASIVAADTTFLGHVAKQVAEENANSTEAIYRSTTTTTSIFNPNSAYGSIDGNFSPWNERTRTAPRVVSKDGTHWAYLSLNPGLNPRIDPYALVAFVKSR